ncbi:MAG: 30S ribosomal protein S12 methylthiotransferase RimO [Defluviitaleaceae bacterium]|nr:30S ribosomal protein S12 methylthiotransferase RimO [Defluviitaleaceae bacterium]
MTNPVYLLSLGCDKNRVDGEVMLGRLLAEGLSAVDTPEEAEIIIVNTCGFIREAVQESIDHILEMAAYKKSGICRALVVVGCMTERYRAEMKAEMPEVDAILGVADRDGIAAVVQGLLSPEGVHQREGTANEDPLRFRLLARKNTAYPHIAYVKIAEGCDNHCAYCTIPAIRGGYKSREMPEILEECKALIDSGVRELVLVAQDTALYGKDVYGGPRLAELLRELDALCGASGDEIWLRLLYAYPEHITPELIQALGALPSVCKYLDMPIQHSEDAVLARMGRAGSRDALKDLLCRLRAQVPGIVLRTTLMVGFPGEREVDFRGLYAFVKEARFDRLGVFPYSQEAGTPAASMPRQIKDEVKHRRRDALMALQQRIHRRKQRDKIGVPLAVMVDGPGDAPGEDYIGRTRGDAHEVDAVVYFSSPLALAPGQIVQVCPVDADEYDLYGARHEPSE